MSNEIPGANGIFCQGYQGGCSVALTSGEVVGVEYARKHKCAFLGLSITQLIFGICLIGIGIAAIPICTSTYGCASYNDDWYNSYYGVWTMMSTNIWGGALVVLFAIFGLVQVCKPSICSIVTNLSLSIVGTIVTFSLMALEITAACSSYTSSALVVLHSVAAGIDFISFILFIIGCSYAGRARGCCLGCCDTCCESCILQGKQEVVTFVPGLSEAQVVTLSSGKQIILRAQPQSSAGLSYAAQPPQYSMMTPQVHGSVNAPIQPGTSNAGAINQTYVVDTPEKA